MKKLLLLALLACAAASSIEATKILPAEQACQLPEIKKEAETFAECVERYEKETQKNPLRIRSNNNQQTTGNIGIVPEIKGGSSTPQK